MRLEKLEWDTNFFNYNIGRIIIDEKQALHIPDFLSVSKDFKLVYIFSIFRIQNELFKLVDEKVVLHQQLRQINIEFTSDFYSIKSFNNVIHSQEELQALAIESGTYSRFKNDENFKSGEFFKLYQQWISLSIKGDLAFDIIVATDKNESIIGFITLNKKNESLVEIGLFAVLGAYRSKGIGKKLLQYAINKSCRLGFKEIQVVTQFNNVNAFELYRNFGFEIKEKTFVYHFWNL